MVTHPFDLLPEPPDDGYDWNRFFGDQSSAPSIFHGTSAAFTDSIASHGLSASRRPYDSSDIERVIDILKRYNLYGPRDANRGVLESFTGTSIRIGSISFTFDWLRACRYALYRGGETLEHLLLLLDWSLGDKRGIFALDEVDFLAALETRLKSVLGQHSPLIVSVAFDPAWFYPGEELEFFINRQAFERHWQQNEQRLFGNAKYLGSHRRETGITINGQEFFAVTDVPQQRSAT